MIERRFDIPFIGRLALREKQIQQNYRPYIAIHKWFARRPGTLFRGLLLSEFCDQGLSDSFYGSHDLRGIRIADPFMGGGTPLLEANRMGCDVIGYDINPMSYWIVRQGIADLDLAAYDKAVHQLREHLEREIGLLHRTRCECCGNMSAHVKYFLWVKTVPCPQCGENVSLFPGFLVAENARHPRNVLLCPSCGNLVETEDRENAGSCPHCHAEIKVKGPARKNRCPCPRCGHEVRYPVALSTPPDHRLFAIEYHCPNCESKHIGRFFKAPDADDLARANTACEMLHRMGTRFVPDEEIPPGDETNRLLRWGYRRYREMFHPRQLVGLELSARFIAGIEDRGVREALATNLSDLLRYQNMLCRYDNMALKSLDIFSVHGFPVGLIQCESNILGIHDVRKNTCVGSGGWANIAEKFRKAKAYCAAPFEVCHEGRRKNVMPIRGEWIGEEGQHGDPPRKVEIQCRDSSMAEIPAASLDAVFTDPPYFGNVQYAELMDFCYVWLRRLVRDERCVFLRPTTRNADELTGNESMGRGLPHFTKGLAGVFQRMGRALKPGAPLAFTYHHNDEEAYHSVAVAVLDAGLVCSGSLPCPGEMGASIHISGTGSAIVDTVFVCRSTGTVPRRWIQATPEGLAKLVAEDVAQLTLAGMTPTDGDIRCIAHGHLTRMAIWALRSDWRNAPASIEQRLQLVGRWMRSVGGWAAIGKALKSLRAAESQAPGLVMESPKPYGAEDDEVSF